MDALKLLKDRKTSYDFSNKKVSKLIIKKLLKAGQWAPSSLNAQPWKFIVITDLDKITKLVDSSFYGDFHTIPTLIIALVLDHEFYEGTHRGVKDGKVGLYDAYLSIAMPALQMCLEAESLGVANCILTPNELTASKLLKTPKKDQIPLMVAFGYEIKNAFHKKRERKELKDITYKERYGVKYE